MRDKHGRFLKGCKAGPGAPLGQRVNTLRAELVKAVTIEDIQAICKRLIQMAKLGDLGAIKELFNRVLGQPLAFDMLERIEELEKQLSEDDDHPGPKIGAA